MKAASTPAPPVAAGKSMRRLPAILSAATGVFAPLVLSLLWVPIRSALPNTALALVLVLAVLVIGTFGRRVAVLVAAGSAGLSFDYFNTRPFEHVAIERWLDLETTVALGAVSAIGGELAVRVARGRGQVRSDSVRAASIGEAASLLASGEELALVIERIGDGLRELLGLAGCTFGAGGGDDTLPLLERDGTVVSREPCAPAPLRSQRRAIVLQVWGHAQVLGHYVLELAPGAPLPGHEDLAAAVTLADQVGAAFMTQAPPPPDRSAQPAPNLHVVR
jgi:K+-sensing histidine kinase KdpD